MLLNKEIFNSKSNIKKILIVLKTLTPEKSFYFYLSIVSIMTLCFFAISMYLKDNHTTEKPTYNQILNIHTNEKIKNYMPIFAETKTEKIISALLFAGLIKNNNNSYSADLAESVYISDTGLEINVKLKDNIKFSDGTDIKSDDIIYTYKLMQSFEVDNKDRAKYEGLTFQKIDDKNIIISLKKSYSQISNLLTLGIISKDTYAEEKINNFAGSEKNLKPVSSGQYYVNDYIITDNNITELIISNNNNYYTLSNFSKINFYTEKLENNQSVIRSYFSKNNIDMSIDNSIRYLPADQDDKDYTEEYTKTNISSNVFLNPNKNEIFSKKINREFLYTNIDRNYIVNNILDTKADTSFDIMPGSKNLEALPIVNIEDTTFGKSTSTKYIMFLSYLNTDTNQKIYNYIYNNFIKYNIEIKGVPVNQEELQNIIKNRDFEMLLTNIEIEDVSSLYSFLHSSQKNAPGLNVTNYISKNFDKNIDVLRYATSSEELSVALENMRQEFYQEYPYIPLYSKNNKIIKSSKLNIKIDKETNSTDNKILENIPNAYKYTEKIYNFLSKYQDIIIKVNKIIH